nr:hypothetical protein [Tanacetum cinerariifolium]
LQLPQEKAFCKGVQCDGVGSYDWSFQADEELTNYALMAFTSSSSSSSDNENETVFEEDIKLLKLDVMLRDNALVELKKKFEKAGQERDNDELISSASDVRTFMPPKPDLVFHNAPTVNETVFTAFNVKPSTTKPNKDLSPSNSPSAPIIEDWVSDSKDDSKGEPMPTQKSPSFVHSSEHI